MREAIGLAAALCLALGVAAPAAATGNADTLRGKVTKKEGNTLTIRETDGRSVRVQTNDRTRFVGEEGARASLSDVDTGDQVMVTAMASSQRQGGERTAEQVRIESSSGTNAKPSVNPNQGSKGYPNDNGGSMGVR